MNTITVEGEYYGEGNSKKHFKLDFEVEADDKYLALSEVQNNLVNPKLKEKDAASKGFYTCGVVDFKINKGKAKAKTKAKAQDTEEDI